MDSSQVHTSNTLDIDDAFVYGEDDRQISLGLSASTIQQDLAKYHQENLDDHRNVLLNSNLTSLPQPDTSVSSFDLDSTSPYQRSLSQLSNEFSQVSLDDERSPQSFSLPQIEESVDNMHERQASMQEHSAEEPMPYPSVVIEISNDAAQTVIVDPAIATVNGTTKSPSTSSLSTPTSTLEVSRAGRPSTETSSSPRTPEMDLPPLPSPSKASSNLPPSPSTASQTVAKSGHRPARSVGPSMLEKVISKTRPQHLPPKARAEDLKHMAVWGKMMAQSRAAEEKRRKAFAARRLERENQIERSLHIWEREILPDWQAAKRYPRLRQLWWNGIPTKLRATLWERAVGNALALSKDNFRNCLARAKRAINSGTFPSETMKLIEEDIDSTLPSLHIFHREGPMYEDLKDILCAWVVARSDERLGYVNGVARVAALFLITMPPPQAFVVMRNMLERHCLRAFYGGDGAKDDVEAYYRIFDTLLADGMPKIYFNFKQHHVSPSAYLPEWLIPLFLDHLPFEACARIWDVIILEGDSFLYRVALGILAVLEPRLFFPDKQELMELLRGENKAAIEVARREGQSLDGGKYEIYNVNEETLWERIDSMEEWWKESTWTRLITRELPDI